MFRLLTSKVQVLATGGFDLVQLWSARAEITVSGMQKSAWRLFYILLAAGTFFFELVRSCSASASSGAGHRLKRPLLFIARGPSTLQIQLAAFFLIFRNRGSARYAALWPTALRILCAF